MTNLKGPRIDTLHCARIFSQRLHLRPSLQVSADHGIFCQTRIILGLHSLALRNGNPALFLLQNEGRLRAR